MKFEKLSKDKIKVTINTDDLDYNNIDFSDFMTNSDETHSLFLHVLETAEKDYGFSTENYNLKVETVALSNGNFSLTITRVLDNVANSEVVSPKKPRVSRKIPNINSTSVIYKFNSFDDFCNLSNSLNNSTLFNYKQISKDSVLYYYKDKYYLLLKEINIKFHNLKGLFAIFTEFATYVNSSNIFNAKLYESGKVIFKKRALQNCIKYFN